MNDDQIKGIEDLLYRSTQMSLKNETMHYQYHYKTWSSFRTRGDFEDVVSKVNGMLIPYEGRPCSRQMLGEIEDKVLKVLEPRGFTCESNIFNGRVSITIRAAGRYQYDLSSSITMDLFDYQEDIDGSQILEDLLEG